MNLEGLLESALLFMLVFLRVAAALAVMPVYGYRGLALPVKVGLAGFLALFLLPMTQPPPGWQSVGMGLPAFLGLAVPEVVAGLLLGLVCHFIFYGVELSGQLLGMQMGFGIVNVIDPHTEMQVSIISQMQYLFALLIFLSFNGHLYLLEGLGQSFQVVPLGGARFPSGLADSLVRLTGGIFVAAIKIAAPVMAALFLADVGLGIIARTVPQMNIFIIGFPLKIGLGLLALALSWPLFTYALEILWKNFQGEWTKFIALLSP